MYDSAKRASRERCAWEQAYTAGTSAHERYLWTKRIERVSHIERQFYRRLDRFSGMRILSIGGGVDRVANYLASRGNRVISADISFNAATATRNFDGLSSIPRVHPVVADCQEQCFQNRSFDAVVSKRALHHMDITRVASIVYELLVSGGIFLAEEPICLSPLLRSIHREVPFHPQAIRTEDERELGGDDLQVLGTRFHSMNIRYFDLFARESIAYCLCRLRLDSILLKPLGRLDDFAANQCLPWLRRFCSYAIIECRK